MNNLSFSLVLLVFSTSTLYSQVDKSHFQFNNEYVLEIFEDGDPLSSCGLSAGDIQKVGNVYRKGLFWFSDSALSTQNNSKCKVQKRYINIETGGSYVFTSRIMIRFNESVNQAVRDSVASEYGLSIKDTSISELLMIFQTSNDPLQISNDLYSTGLVKFAIPDFYSTDLVKTTSANDEFYSKQWYLHNTGQLTNDGHYGTVDADIDAPEAWAITKGSSFITIAVIDEGVPSSHVDLPSSRIIIKNGSNFGNGNADEPYPDYSTSASNNHGLACAGVIGATHNTIGIAGVAPLCKIMPVKISFATATTSGSSVSDCIKAVKFAADEGADIISNSWGFSSSSPNSAVLVFADAVEYAIDAGAIVLFPAGNTADRSSGNTGFVIFPSNDGIEGLITVGASDRDNQVANYSPNGLYLDIVAPSHTAYNSQDIDESLNIWTLDLPDNEGSNPWKLSGATIPVYNEKLPGSGVSYKDFTGRFGGTSAAVPQAAGVSALVKSVNMCIGPHGVKHILQYSADKIPGYDYNYHPYYPGLSEEVGYGKLNAHKAVLAAQQFYSSNLDLFMRDRYNDLGTDAGYAWTWDFDNCPDIWVRNQDDGEDVLMHESIEYDANSPAYVYVRIGNKSCTPSSGSETISVYWSKASSNSSWPTNWTGGNVHGGLVASKTIPVLQPGESTIIKMEWPVPAGIGTSWNVCLLARIENSTVDPITVHSGNLAKDIYENNNVSLRNLVITNYDPGVPFGGTKWNSIVNTESVPKAYDISLFSLQELPQYGEVVFEIHPDDWGKISSSLARVNGVEVTGDFEFRVIGEDSVVISSLKLAPFESIRYKLSVNFLVDVMDTKLSFDYHVIQSGIGKDSDNRIPYTGGMHFIFNHEPRFDFQAEASSDDESIVIGDSTLISVSDIGESAEYLWYDINGASIGSGTSIYVHPEQFENYTVVVQTQNDKFRDYDNVEVEVNQGKIISVSPNPVNDNLTLNYVVAPTSNSYVSITNTISANQVNTYLISPYLFSANLDVSSLPTGIYAVTLYVNGVAVDNCLLSKN